MQWKSCKPRWEHNGLTLISCTVMNDESPVTAALELWSLLHFKESLERPAGQLRTPPRPVIRPRNIYRVDHVLADVARCGVIQPFERHAGLVEPVSTQSPSRNQLYAGRVRVVGATQ